MMATTKDQVESPGAWLIFDDWREPTRGSGHGPSSWSSWRAVQELVDAFDGYARAVERVLEAELVEWDRDLAEFGGDPVRTDWTHFRPLRLSREEDWSDWLGFLLETSATGVTGCYLFGAPGGDSAAYARPAKVEREVIVEPFRADLVIRWSGSDATHVEVKIGDQSLEKTFSTARRLRETFGRHVRRWTDFILLLPAQTADWESVVDRASADVQVHCVTWQDVSIGLRRGLLADEPIIWKSFACAFTGAIEQTLLRFTAPQTGTAVVATVEQQLSVLQEGRHDG